MSVVNVKKAVKRGERRLAAVVGVRPRGLTLAKAQVRDLATQGERLAHEVDGQVARYTGRRTAAWIDGASRLAGNHRWAASGLAALALYALLVLLV